MMSAFGTEIYDRLMGKKNGSLQEVKEEAPREKPLAGFYKSETGKFTLKSLMKMLEDKKDGI